MKTHLPTLCDAYEKKTTAGSQADVYAQHEIIANKFVNIIASTVQNFTLVSLLIQVTRLT
jgi:hypothetical protein